MQKRIRPPFKFFPRNTRVSGVIVGPEPRRYTTYVIIVRVFERRKMQVPFTACPRSRTPNKRDFFFIAFVHCVQVEKTKKLTITYTSFKRSSNTFTYAGFTLFQVQIERQIKLIKFKNITVLSVYSKSIPTIIFFS